MVPLSVGGWCGCDVAAEGSWGGESLACWMVFWTRCGVFGRCEGFVMHQGFARRCITGISLARSENPGLPLAKRAGGLTVEFCIRCRIHLKKHW